MCDAMSAAQVWISTSHKERNRVKTPQRTFAALRITRTRAMDEDERRKTSALRCKTRKHVDPRDADGKTVSQDARLPKHDNHHSATPTRT